MKVCEVCGSRELEDNDDELHRRILHVCDNCIGDQKPVPKEDD